ncbi:MAG: VOC family protein [Pseudomonas sp.]
MTIRQLGYLIFSSADVAGWRTLAENVIGFSTTDNESGSLYLKMDERDFRIAVLPGQSEQLVASGWEIDSQSGFEEVRLALVRNDVEWHQGSAEECAFRKVQEFIWFQDPDGNRIELYWCFISAFLPFSPPKNISVNFVTDGIGMGHVVLPTADLDSAQAFYERTLGFGLSDIIKMQFGPGKVRVNFNHCGNQRQHSLALAEMPSPNGCVHFCIEVASLKEVGMALDRVQVAGHPLVLTLGQHVNDDCVSFYFLSPHGFMIEIGHGAIYKDWDRHTVFETTRASHWGHHFVLNR